MAVGQQEQNPNPSLPAFRSRARTTMATRHGNHCCAESCEDHGQCGLGVWRRHPRGRGVGVLELHPVPRRASQGGGCPRTILEGNPKARPGLSEGVRRRQVSWQGLRTNQANACRLNLKEDHLAVHVTMPAAGTSQLLTIKKAPAGGGPPRPQRQAAFQ